MLYGICSVCVFVCWVLRLFGHCAKVFIAFVIPTVSVTCLCFHCKLRADRTHTHTLVWRRWIQVTRKRDVGQCRALYLLTRLHLWNQAMSSQDLRPSQDDTGLFASEPLTWVASTASPGTVEPCNPPWHHPLHNPPSVLTCALYLGQGSNVCGCSVLFHKCYSSLCKKKCGCPLLDGQCVTYIYI